jgi:hypothetical protein
MACKAEAASPLTREKMEIYRAAHVQRLAMGQIDPVSNHVIEVMSRFRQEGKTNDSEGRNRIHKSKKLGAYNRL